jgi:hypothetical protein
MQGAKGDVGETGATGPAESLKTTLILNNSTAGIHWDITDGYNAKLTLIQNVTLYISNVVDGDQGNLIVIQDNTGGHILTIDGTGLYEDFVELPTDANSKSIVSFLFDDDEFFWNIGGPYS